MAPVRNQEAVFGDRVFCFEPQVSECVVMSGKQLTKSTPPFLVVRVDSILHVVADVVRCRSVVFVVPHCTLQLFPHKFLSHNMEAPSMFVERHNMDAFRQRILHRIHFGPRRDT